MSQIFHRSTNTISRVTIFGSLALAAAIIAALAAINESSYITDVGVARIQPVPFSHKHHVTDDGIDCRYCHTSVESSSFAGIPSTKICMNCHTQIWSDSQMLAPVRESFRTGRSLEWTRVHNLPGFVYFDHGIHVNKGVGCTTCHGQVDQMPLMWRENSLYMKWCLDCHRNPERFVRPRQYVFSTDYRPPSDQITLGKRLVKEYRIQKLTSCSTCHR
ncbi:MAG TPA: cytochrome c3 family protein [Blastocatellia bacterium]|nr:cytochrome c3 family protein [Blastocatellia bacterium]